MTAATNPIISTQISAADQNPPLNAVEIQMPELDENGQFKDLIETQDVLKKIKAGLITAIENMEKTPSLISRAAEFWGKLALWQKILGGVAITLPTLVLGIVANINFLLVICCITTLIYTGLALVLDDHYKNKIAVMGSLINGILGLADFLESTIRALDTIRQKLAVQVDAFAAENKALKTQVDSLGSKIILLDTEIQAAAEASASLQKTKEDLEQVSGQLNSTVTEQSDLLDKNQKELQRIMEAYDASQLELTQKITELDLVKTDLGFQLDQARNVAKILQDSVLALSGTLITNNEDRQLFQQKIDEFLNDKNKNFDQLLASYSETQKEYAIKYALIERQFRQCNEQYEEKLQELNRQIERLTLISAEQYKKTSSGVGPSLIQTGIFAKNPNTTKDPIIVIMNGPFDNRSEGSLM